jgi:hypothetical protein
MKKFATKGGVRAAAFAVLSVLLLTACEDPRRVSWSPDGNTAAILTGDGLRISDADGNLGEPKPDVELVTWVSDNRHLLTVEYEKVDTWEKFKSLETPEDLKRVMTTATAMLAAAKQSKGNWEVFQQNVGKMTLNREAILFLRDNKEKDMATLGENWTQVKKTVDVGVHRICSYTVENKALSERKEIYRTLRDVKEVRVNPIGSAFLLVYKPESDTNTAFTLAVVSMETGKAVTVSRACSAFPDWNSDSMEFYYIEADLLAKLREGTESALVPVIGSLYRHQIDPVTSELEPESNKARLSRLYFNRNSRVRALADHSLVFSTAPVELPGNDTQIVRKQSLFFVNPGKNAMVSPMIPRDEPDVGGDLMEFFEVNSSGNLIAIPSTKEGTTVYDVRTGSTRRVDGGGFQWSRRLAFMPTWRNESELCLGMKPVKAAPESEQNEVVLWNSSDEGVRPISEKWPATARKKLLD